MNPYRPTILSPEASAEAGEESTLGSSLLPEPEAVFEQACRREEVRKRAGETRDTALPEDHEAFVEVRSLGFRAIRQKLEARRKRK